MRSRIDFAAVNRAVLPYVPLLLKRWLPGGRMEGYEYVVCNPMRSDHRPGSFKINIITGRWADFAVDAKGSDPISLAAYLGGIGQYEAARNLGEMLGVLDDGEN